MPKNSEIIKLYLFVSLVATVLLLATFVKLPEINEGNAFFEKVKLKKKDWHDYKFMEIDARRIGIGESGAPAYITNEELKKLESKISQKYGFNALLSDLISVNRSVPDIRHRSCRSKLYRSELPSVSVIMPFHEEHLSVLLRSIHSLINRSPPELLREVILVDDGSKRESLHTPLDRYVAENFSKVQILRLSNRSGLIRARLAGARSAMSEVFVFLDSHIEVNYNWLPPLLEPISQDPRTVVCPFIDAIDDKTFSYTAQDEGARGGFNWIFDYKRLPLLPEDLLDRTRPFKSPVMAGGLFAIAADFFWELGGYDEGLEIWGGEQYELSFKIWMCGGNLLDAPCSRVGHIFRGQRVEDLVLGADDDVVRKNYKRVAEVWMDEYKQYLYAHDDAYREISAGDLTSQKALREKLKCKSFKWYMENVAFDLLEIFPPVEPPDYANGTIQSLAHPMFCIDTLNHEAHTGAGLFTCSENKTHPPDNQNWALSAHRDLRVRSARLCLRVETPKPNAEVLLWECHEEGGDQFWYYNPDEQWLVFERNGRFCLEAVFRTSSLCINRCRKNNLNMKWKFGFVNSTALASFFDNIPDISYAF